MSKVVKLALKILDMPEGPDHKTLQKEARAYLKTLSAEDYGALKDEALVEGVKNPDDYVDGLELFKKLCFTSKESQAYAGMRINSPGVRRVIARRALLMKFLKRETLPEGMSFYEVARMEDSMLTGMSSEEVLRELKRAAGRN